MRRMILAAAMMAAALAPAFAGDLPTKAPPAAVSSSTPCTPTQCSGWYVGGVLANGIFAGDVGYQYWNSVAFLGFEGAFGGQVYTDAALTHNENGFFSYQIAKAGGSYTGLLGQQPAPPSGFPSITAQVIAPYALAGAVERDMKIGGLITGWAVGGGTEFAVSNKAFVDLKYMYVNYGNAALPSESLILAGWNYKF